LFILFLCFSCTQDHHEYSTLINTQHLDHLYEEIELKDQPVAVIHIYANAPDYNWTDAPGEGIACVDDVARAAVFYSRHFKYSGNKVSEHKAKRLLTFVKVMQADNGYFYNFIDEEYQIEKDTWNSKPVDDWWTWRAMWALAEGIQVFSESDDAFSAELKQSLDKAVDKCIELTNNYPQTTEFEGITVPNWLPRQYAADQAAVLLLALSEYYPTRKDKQIFELMHQQAEGIIKMQIGDTNQFPYGAILSWKNLWHAYGNIQSDALLKVGDLVSDSTLVNSALLEIDHFYPYLIEQNYINFLWFEQKSDSILIKEEKKYEQIAYGIRPMVWAALRAAEITGNTNYAKQAGEIAAWLFGKNPAEKLIYDPRTGRCFDGINSPNEVNLNSGAESTIEALLTVLEAEKNPITKSIINSYYKKVKTDQ
jgi:hypothetical protein